MPINFNKIQAVIFDMDGVISDTQGIYSAVESDFFKDYGINLTPDEITMRYAGVVSKDMIPHAFKSFGKELPKSLEELSDERLLRIKSAFASNVIEEVPGTREFIMHLKQKNIPIGIGSASRIATINMILNALGLLKYFNAIASSEEVEHGKPEPDLFLLAAQRLGVPPQNCLVIEDGINGMIAAENAGMQCVGLVRHDELDYNVYPANLLVRNLVELIPLL